MKQRGFNFFGVMPVTEPEIQNWIDKVAPGISQLQRKEYERQWNAIDKIRQAKSIEGF
jgi:hypothetical protein